jgi:hypothetical protein
MTNATAGFTCDTLLRQRIEKLRRKEKDVRLHNRLSALLLNPRLSTVVVGVGQAS